MVFLLEKYQRQLWWTCLFINNQSQVYIGRVQGNKPQGSNNSSIEYKHPLHMISLASQHNHHVLCQMALWGSPQLTHLQSGVVYDKTITRLPQDEYEPGRGRRRQVTGKYPNHQTRLRGRAILRGPRASCQPHGSTGLSRYRSNRRLSRHMLKPKEGLSPWTHQSHFVLPLV